MKFRELKSYMHLALTIFAAAAMSIIFFFLFSRIGAIFSALGIILNALLPIIYGAVFAFILHPICRFFEKLVRPLFKNATNRARANKLIRYIGIFAGLLLGLLSLYILLLMIIPQIYESILNIINNYNRYLDATADFINTTLDDNPELRDFLTSLVTQYSAGFQELLTGAAGQLGDAIQGITTGVINVFVTIFNIIVGVIVAVYILAARSNFKKATKKFIDLVFSKKWAAWVKEEVIYTNKVVVGFVESRILSSVIIGLLCYILMLVIGIPFPLLVSVIIAVTNVIPVFGPFIGGIPAGLLILMESPIHALFFVIMIVGLQLVEGYIISPYITSESIGLSSFWVLFAVLLFGSLFGFVGMLAGVPVFAVFYDIVQKIVKVLEEKKKEKLARTDPNN